MMLSRKYVGRWLLCWAVMLSCAISPSLFAAELTPDQERHFEEKIRPLLAGRCIKCHGPAKQESDLRLDSREAMLRGGAQGEKAVIPGDPENSLLIKALKYEGDLQMPPDARLASEEVALLTGWIKDGAPWPASAAAERPLTIAERVQRDRGTHWAFQPLIRPIPSGQPAQSPVRSPIDAFLADKQREKGLSFSPEADRRTLLRRATFDLLGLPPTIEDVEAFAADSAPDAYERQVDRLLASPRYGERWGRHWLDVARYADTKGYAFQSDRRYPYAYTYRDYVIQAFNRDLPYDRFLLEQLAADQLPLGDDKSSLAAMGFLTVGRKYNNMNDDIDDLIDVVCRGVMGLTVSCARCHDHKYDAVPTEDYYSLYGVFASSKQPEELPVIGESFEKIGIEQYEQELQKRKSEVENFTAQKRGEITAKARERVADYLVRASVEKNDANDKAFGVSLGADELKPKLIERWRQYLKENARVDHPTLGLWKELTALSAEEFAEKSKPILEKWGAATQGLAPGQINPQLKAIFAETPPAGRVAVANLYGKLLTAALAEWKKAGGDAAALEKLPPEWRQPAEMIAGPGSPTDIPPGESRGYFNRAEQDKLRDLQKKVDAFTADSPAAPPRAMVLKENPSPHQPHVFIRGNQARAGKQVPRQFPVVLTGPERKPFAVRSGRLELAEQVVAPTNALTPRVFANRVWMYHFGEPLVSTPSDFGVRVDRPIQDRLLNWLAGELRDGSAAGGSVSPTAWSIKHLHRQIMTSHAYRQASLDRPEIRAIDPENRLFARMNRRRLEFEPLRDAFLAAGGELNLTIGGRSNDLFKAPFTKRRTVYGYIDRQDLPNLFRVFDIASPDQSSPRRSQTTVPQQALFLMNSPFLIERAQALSEHPAVQSDDPTARIVAFYRLLFARPPTAVEIELGRDFIASADSAGEKLSPWQQYAQLLLLTNEFAYVD